MLFFCNKIDFATTKNNNIYVWPHKMVFLHYPPLAISPTLRVVGHFCDIQ